MGRTCLATDSNAVQIIAGLDLAGDNPDISVIFVTTEQGPWEIAFEAFDFRDVPIRPDMDIYKEKPWLRMQDNYESGKLRRKGRK